jgi:N-acetylglucosaminyldiphosphoundecaprenol N-acetyl-beta-D-mannosaminyltransferase
VKIYDIDIFSSDKNALLTEIENRLNGKEKFTIMSVNPEIILEAEKNSKIKDTLKKSEINIPDGNGTLLLAKKKGEVITERIAGYDLFKDLCKLSIERNEEIFLFGAEEWVVNAAVVKLEKEFPSIKIVGHLNGYEKNWESVVEKINKTNAHYLFIAMGSPYQELFIEKYRETLNVQLIQPVGGSFDVVAGKVKRAPKWVQQIKLEWLYRLATDLKRIKRIIKMLMFVAAEMIKKGEKK